MTLLRRLVVEGGSMRPTLQPGDRLVAIWWPWLRAGHLVAVPDPRVPARRLVKRVASVSRETLEVVGDDPVASTDSRSFGAVPRRRARRVVLRYAPAPRARWLWRCPWSPADRRAQRVAYDPVMAAAPLEQVLAPDYLAGLDELPIETIRVKRAESQELELALSYARRLVQGRLDIVQAEVERRASGRGPSNPSELVAQLQGGDMFSGHPRPPGFGRLPAVLEPGDVADEIVREIDEVVDPARLSRIGELTDAEVGDLNERLGALERRLSNRRRALFDVIDACQAEIVRRYKTGSASPDALLS